MNRLGPATSWFERTPLGDEVTRLTEPHVHPLLRCNIYHVRGRNHDLVIDTGLGVAQLTQAARDLFERPVLAVATHAHMDHIGGLHEFDRRAVHHLEADDLANATGELPLDIAMYDDGTLDALAAMGYDIRGGLLTAVPVDGFQPSQHTLAPTEATMLLQEGDVIDLGNRAFEVLHLPGHSPGSIGLLDRSNGVLFSGDAVYDGPLLDEIPGSNIDDYVNTMTRLLTLDVSRIYGGHDRTMNRERFHSIITSYLALKGAA